MLKLSCSLYPSVAYLANLSWVESIPFGIVKFSIEIFDKFGVYKVDKSISNITIILNRYKGTL